MKYKINFSGFAYVEANDAKEAEDKFSCEDTVYEEYGIDDVELVDDFYLKIWGVSENG